LRLMTAARRLMQRAEVLRHSSDCRSSDGFAQFTSESQASRPANQLSGHTHRAQGHRAVETHAGGELGSDNDSWWRVLQGGRSQWIVRTCKGEEGWPLRIPSCATWPMTPLQALMPCSTILRNRQSPHGAKKPPACVWQRKMRRERRWRNTKFSRHCETLASFGPQYTDAAAITRAYVSGEPTDDWHTTGGAGQARRRRRDQRERVSDNCGAILARGDSRAGPRGTFYSRV